MKTSKAKDYFIFKCNICHKIRSIPKTEYEESNEGYICKQCKSKLKEVLKDGNS